MFKVNNKGTRATPSSAHPFPTNIFPIFQYLPLYAAHTLEFWKVLKKGKDSHELGLALTQPAITCSKLPKETLEQGMKYVQS